MRFYLGTHHPNQRWFDLGVPLFVSTRALRIRQSFPSPKTWWALDSGAFTELDRRGEFETSAAQYAAEVDRYIVGGMTKCAFVSPQDWMCEPEIRAKTGLTTEEHQRRTVLNFLDLRGRLGGIVIPVVQGWERDDYLRCVDLYERFGVDLGREPLVGVGSVCRRQNTKEGEQIFRSLFVLGLKLHGYGVKVEGLQSYSDVLSSADSMAWSLQARIEAHAHDKQEPLFSWPREMLCGGIHPLNHRAKSCSNCIDWAMRWRAGFVNEMEVAA